MTRNAKEFVNVVVGVIRRKDGIAVDIKNKGFMEPEQKRSATSCPS